MQAVETDESTLSCDVVILGAGYAGLLAALRLRRRDPPLRIILVNREDRFVERVRLQESIVAELAPPFPSIAAFVEGGGVEFLRGEVLALDPARRLVRIEVGGTERDIAFDQAIYALGSGVDLTEVRGAAEHAYRLEPGDAPHGAAALRARLEAHAGEALRVIVVGGAESAIEAAAEIKTTYPKAEVTMVSRSRCAGFKGTKVEQAIREELTRLGVAMIDNETVVAVDATKVTLQSGRELDHDLCVFAGGLRTAPIAAKAGPAADWRGRVLVDPNLRSISHPQILAIGDAAHPVAPTGAPYRLSAFAALVSGAYAADLILAERAGRELPPFSFSTFGQGIAIGRHGVGFPTFPNDRAFSPLFTGRTAIQIRNIFVRLLIHILKLERRFPGAFFWLGRRRVSWQRAKEAMREAFVT
jgi:NADH dehydrogenase FAD-containing subunit